MRGKQAALLGPVDNVATALSALSKGTTVQVAGKRIRLADNIPYAHKFALQPIKNGEYVIKRGQIVGRARIDIKRGELVHRHNLEPRVEVLMLNWMNELRRTAWD